MRGNIIKKRLISLAVEANAGSLLNANDINLFLMIFTRTSLHCKLVPVQYREHEYGQLRVESNQAIPLGLVLLRLEIDCVV